MKMSDKTLAMRVLEGRKVDYKVHTYPEQERDAEKIAEWLEIPADRVFKTLVAVREQGKPILVMVPGSHQLDLKKLAKEVGEKKIKLASHLQAEALTGLQVGGISPLALMNKGFVLLLDRSAAACNTICISAGKKGLNVELNPAELVRITSAQYVDVIS
jgi:Cys-tRNA(Pro)/Cys-tRNA(Cys) deacylase